MSNQDKVFPFPALVRDKERGSWKVREMKKNESPRVDLAKREMIVPYGDSELEANARQHEVGHAAWTDDKMMKELVEQYGVSNLLVQGVEDARINTNLGNLGLPQDAVVFDSEGLGKVTMMAPQDQLGLLFATIATGDEPGVRSVVSPVLGQFVDQVLAEAGLVKAEGVINEDQVTRTAVRLVTEAAAGGSPDPEPEPGEGEPGEDGEPADGDGEGTGTGSFTFVPGGGGGRPVSLGDLSKIEAKRPEFTAMIEKERKRRKAKKPKDSGIDSKLETKEGKAMAESLASFAETADGVKPIPGHLLEEDGIVVKHGVKRSIDEPRGDSGQWAPMRIVEPARPERVPSRVRGRAKGVNDTGAIPVAMHRITIDSRVFRATRIKPMAGTVLIDNSGSMGFQKEDLVRIMAALPAATIAEYSTRGLDGQLKIVASKGRMISQKELAKNHGSGNGCDGLALRWLVQQPGPRFWVSDGGVTGRGDAGFRGAGEECLVLCRAGKVTQFFGVDELEQMLESGKLSLRRHPPLRDRDRPPYRIMGNGGWLS